MKWLSDHNVDIALTRRFIGNEKDGLMDVYQLDMILPVGERLFIWAMYISLERIKDLQKYVKIGITAGKKKLNGLNS